MVKYTGELERKLSGDRAKKERKEKLASIVNGMHPVLSFVSAASIAPFMYTSTMFLSSYLNTRNAIIEKTIQDAEVVTPQVYASAVESANEIARGDFYAGLFHAAAAGMCMLSTYFNLKSSQRSNHNTVEDSN